MEHAVQTIRGGHGDPCGVPPKAAYRQMVFSPLGKGSKAGTDGMSAKTAARPPNPEAGYTEVNITRVPLSMSRCPMHSQHCANTGGALAC